MPVDLKAVSSRIWLMEENDFRMKLNHIAMFKTCYSGKEVAKLRRKMLDQASNILTSGAIKPSPTGGKIAVIPVFGPIDQRMSSGLAKSGGTSCEELAAMIDACDNDPKVSTVVFQHDSGGGSSSGIQELSDKIFDLRSRKATYSISDAFSASASYWLATSAETMICTPSGEVGSVGAYVIHADESEALAMEGIKITLVKAGKYKAEMAPFQPLSDEAKDHVQAQVDDVYSKFVKAVARNRSTTVADVRQNYGQGRMLNAEAALAAGMVDRIMSMEDLILKLTGVQPEQSSVQRKRAEHPSAEVLRARKMHAERSSSPKAN